MKALRHLLVPLCLSLMFQLASAQAPGDTIEIATFNYSQTYGVNQWSPGIRDSIIDFSVLPDVSYERVLMTYNMRCKGGRVSTGSNRDLGCGEWDISCNTYLHDSTRIDSVLAKHPDYVISGFTGEDFFFLYEPTYTFYQYTEKEVSINNTQSESVARMGSGSEQVNFAIDPQQGGGRSQFLFTAAELSAAGLSAGPIHGLGFQNASGEAMAAKLRIAIKETSKMALAADDVDDEAFSEVYFRSSLIGPGDWRAQFHTPFEWDGTSNLIVESTINSQTAGAGITLAGSEVSDGIGLVSQSTDYYASFGGVGQHIEVEDHGSDFSDGLTMAAWVKYDAFNHWSRILDFGNGSNADNIILANQATTSNLVLSIRIGSSANDIVANGVLKTGEWQHISATITSDNQAKIYVNGVEVASGTCQLPSTVTRSNNYIGRSNWASDGYFDGGIDDVAMWNTALSEEEIKQVMTADLSASVPAYEQLLFGYHFNGDSMDEAADVSANAYIAEKKDAVQSFRYAGADRFKNLVATSLRPNMEFYQGQYNQTVEDIVVVDSVPNPPNIMREYEVVPRPNTLLDDELRVINEQRVWEAIDQPVIDAHTGEVIDEIRAFDEDDIRIDELDYFRRWPSKIEIMSFVTPYGINLNLGPEGETWTFDMTDYLPIFQGRKRMTMERGGQWMEDMDIRFHFIVGTPPRDVLDIKQIWRPESRTYTSIQRQDYFPERQYALLPDGKSYKVRMAISGHGQEGEFIPRTHYVNVNGGDREYSWQVWKECADNPIYPQGGTWVYDRAGWCPGAATDVQHIDITDYVEAGEEVSIDYGLNSASGDSRYIVNGQLVTYGAPNHSVDARVVEVQEPSNRVEYKRFNSICHSPKVVIQNTGEQDLTSLKINYWVNDHPWPHTYEWSGSLAFLESEVVTLPSPETLWGGARAEGNVFHVRISKPNGGSDAYAPNNVYHSPFDLVEAMPSEFVIQFRTNSKPAENRYEIVDAGGQVVHERRNMSANTTYRDTMRLPRGCYTYRVYDNDDDGLAWWANGDGNGSTRFYEPGGGTIKRFDPDFGDNINYSFTVDMVLSYEELAEALEAKVFPNPTSGRFVVEGEGLHDATVQFVNSVGQRFEVSYTTSYNEIQVDASGVAPGLYILHLTLDEKQVSKKVYLR